MGPLLSLARQPAGSASNSLGDHGAPRVGVGKDEGGAPLISDIPNFPSSREQSSHQYKSRREGGSVPSLTHSMGPQPQEQSEDVPSSLILGFSSAQGATMPQ